MIAMAIAMAVALALSPWLARLLAGPTAFDRMLAGHMVWCGAALIAACLGVALNIAALFDAALAFSLVDGVLVLAAVKAQRRNSFQPALAPMGDAPIDGGAAT